MKVTVTFKASSEPDAPRVVIHATDRDDACKKIATAPAIIVAALAAGR